jgi:hypothetical protein
MGKHAPWPQKPQDVMELQEEARRQMKKLSNPQTNGKFTHPTKLGQRKDWTFVKFTNALFELLLLFFSALL